jgi:hypothetical protein
MEKPANGPILITCKKILAVEGKDEKNFFDSLLKHQNISNCQIEEVGGKDQFPRKLPALIKAPGFVNPDGSFAVTHLVIIRDKNGDEALKSIANVLEKDNLVPPEKERQFSSGKPKVGIFIMPGKTIKGTMLEDLCLKTVEDHPAIECVNEFASCVSKLGHPPKNPSKTKTLAFLAAQEEIANTIGLGAQKNYWDFNSPCLDELKAFLEKMR